MKSRSTGWVLAGVASLLWTSALTARAGDDPRSQETPDQRFETLLAAALKAPEKAKWRELREAFSRTTHYQPYSIDADVKLREIAKSIDRGDTKGSEAALLALLERERFMRLDTLAMLVRLYKKTEQPRKAEKYQKLIDGIRGVLKYPDEGTSFEKPITVLFIDEEYFVTAGMPVKQQRLVAHEGHRFDLLEVEADGDKPAKTIYFNIDLLGNARSILGE
jgi:hypothetical protein